MKFLRHVWQSRPGLYEAIFLALTWGAIIPFCVLADYYLWRRMLPPEASRIAAMFSLGAAFAAPISIWCAKIIRLKNANSAFAAMFIFLSLGTFGTTALIFAFDFWAYFSQWHAAAFSKLWVIQFIFTFASAIYQFLVSGLRLYLPFGLVAMVFASLWASKRIMR